MLTSRYITKSSLATATQGWLASIEGSCRPRALPALNTSALVIVDLQRYFAEPSFRAFLPSLDAIVPNVLALHAAFRSAGRPIVLTQHLDPPDQPTPMQRFWRGALRRGDAAAELIPQLARAEADLVLNKASYSAFHETELRQWLDARGCEALVIAGAMSHLCCESTARQAFELGYAPLVVADACVAPLEALHLGALRALAHGFAAIGSTETVISQLVPQTSDRDPRSRSGRADEKEANSSDAGGTATVPDNASGCEDKQREGHDPSAWARGGSRSRPTQRATNAPAEAKLAIIGAGPAGIAAAIQATRLGLAPLLIEAKAPGHHAASGERIENYPGLGKGIAGSEFAARLRAHLAEADIQPLRAEVERLDEIAGGFCLALGAPIADEQATTRRVRANAVILATGTRARPIATPGGDLLRYALPTAAQLRARSVLIIGGGEAAFDQALLAKRHGAAAVTIAARGTPRAMPLLVSRCEAAGIRVWEGAHVAAIERVSAVAPAIEQEAVSLSCRVLDAQGSVHACPADFVIACCGREPRMPRLSLKGQPSLDAEDLSDPLGRSRVAGLYVVGDLRRGRYRQIGIAVGDGLAAAMHAASYLSGPPSLDRWRQS